MYSRVDVLKKEFISHSCGPEESGVERKMKKVMFTAAVAAAGLALGIESANTVGLGIVREERVEAAGLPIT